MPFTPVCRKTELHEEYKKYGCKIKADDYMVSYTAPYTHNFADLCIVKNVSKLIISEK